MKADTLRKKFLDFFRAKRHKIVESDSLVPKDDPTILFTPAGMNQFKRAFLGLDSGFKRIATCQRCLRTDDLEKVGKTCGHHTFFEMLGNFSFGDYFKEEAILWAWEFLTKQLKINPDKLWVSVYKDDREAYKIWKDLLKPAAQRIIKLGDKENFWPSQAKAKGPNGPCGPCSEIFFDQGPEAGCKKPQCNPSCNCGRFLEVWNLVFTQFNRCADGKLEPLPNKNIDTGMGLERLAAVMQGAGNNFETDLFIPLIKELRLEVKSESKDEYRIRAVADHIRAIVFAIYDGALPSNEEQGYVARKLVRRSALHLRALGVIKPFLYKLVPVLAQIMQQAYPELKRQREEIAEIILSEEKNFMHTLNSGEAILNREFQGLIKQRDSFSKEDSEEAGRIAFSLYDTYGIPLELTQEWLAKHRIKVSEAAFERQLQAQRERSKLKSAMKGDVFRLKSVVSGLKETKFLGYQKQALSAKILKIIKDNDELEKIGEGQHASVILDMTPFYAEAGGQIGDSGKIAKGKNVFEITDTQKIAREIIHIGRMKKGSLKKGERILAEIDVERRQAITRNHTATHLLQAALRKVLGAHVKQQGSFVGADRFRFDFTHFKAVDREQLKRAEELVNDYVLSDYRVTIKQLPLAEARKTQALAFFQEKYEGRVRIVSIGSVSKEFCAGTHLDSTGQIGLFKIIQEGSVSSGVRRIEAACGSFSYRMLRLEEDMLQQVSSLLNVPQEKLTQELEKKLSRLKELEKQLSLKKIETVKISLDSLIAQAELIKDIKVLTAVIENVDMDLLRKNVDLIKEKLSPALIALGSRDNQRAWLVIGLAGDLCAQGLDASKLIRDIAPYFGGSGGGRSDFAQAGGANPAGLEEAFKRLKEIIAQDKK